MILDTRFAEEGIAEGNVSTAFKRNDQQTNFLNECLIAQDSTAMINEQ